MTFATSVWPLLWRFGIGGVLIARYPDDWLLIGFVLLTAIAALWSASKLDELRDALSRRPENRTVTG